MAKKYAINNELRHRPTEMVLVAWLLVMALISQLLSAAAIKYGIIQDVIFLILWLSAAIGIFFEKKLGFIIGLVASSASLYKFSLLFIAVVAGMIQGLNKAEAWVTAMLYLPFILVTLNLLFCIKFTIYCFKIFSGKLRRIDKFMSKTLKIFPLASISFAILVIIVSVIYNWNKFPNDLQNKKILWLGAKPSRLRLGAGSNNEPQQ